jgi:hypothetical protein
MFNYDNIGKKIKNLAKWCFIVEAIGAVITGIVLMINASDIDDGFFIAGILTVIFGPIVAWVGSWLLYGYGELIDKACEIERNTFNINKTISETISTANTVEGEIKKSENAIMPAGQEKKESENRTTATEQEGGNVPQTREAYALWEKMANTQRVTFGRCEMCGKKKQQLIFVEVDFFGNTRKNVCYDCFTSYDCHEIE